METGTARTKEGRPSVKVPVLSTTNVSTNDNASIAAASLNKTPALAADPVATITDIGARERCAAATNETICDKTDAAPTADARITNEPVVFIDPPITASPTSRDTGNDSPVNIDSSIDDAPETTTPSTGTRSPGRTRNSLPTMTSLKGTSFSTPSEETNRAVVGCKPSNARRADPVLERARNSSICPSNVNEMIITASSK